MRNRRYGLVLGLMVLITIGLFSIAVPMTSDFELNTELLNERILSDEFTPHDAIEIHGDEEFIQTAEDEGWPGDGSAENPFVISNLLLTDPDTQPLRIWYTTVHWICSNCIFEGGGLCATWIRDSVNGVITNNTVRTRHTALVIDNVVNLTISDNLIYNNTAHGIEVMTGAENLVITNNNIENNLGTGIQIVSGLNCHIKNNQITDNGVNGIRLVTSSGVTIQDNIIHHSLSYGILVTGSQNVVLDNSISSSRYDGIKVTSGSTNTILKNTIQSNRDYGIALGSTCTNSTIRENILIDNGDTCQIYDDGNGNEFIYNYYADWTSPDSNSDNIVDEPYIAEGSAGNSDTYPLTSGDVEIPEITGTGTQPEDPTPVPLELLTLTGAVSLVIILVIVIVIKRKS